MFGGEPVQFFLSASRNEGSRDTVNAATRIKREIIKHRRAGAEKRCLSTYVASVTADAKARKAVTAALRKAAKALREGGFLGKVQKRICRVAATVIGPKYRYTAAQVASIAAAYNPRNAAYKAVREALLAR